MRMLKAKETNKREVRKTQNLVVLYISSHSPVLSTHWKNLLLWHFNLLVACMVGFPWSHWKRCNQIYTLHFIFRASSVTFYFVHPTSCHLKTVFLMWNFYICHPLFSFKCWISQSRVQLARYLFPHGF